MIKEKLFIILILILILVTMPFVIPKILLYQEKDYNEYKEKNISTSKSANEIAEDSYFNDALFIGDSRTVGLQDFGTFDNATFFAQKSMTTYNIKEEKISISNFEKTSLEEILSENQFGKIYIMLGVNEISEIVEPDKNMEANITEYKNLINIIQNKQKNAIIYIQANLHINENILKKNRYVNNAKINKFNQEIAKLANDKNILYLNINEYFDDENGQLNANYTFDGGHVYPKYYREWCDWIKMHTKKY